MARRPARCRHSFSVDAPVGQKIGLIDPWRDLFDAPPRLGGRWADNKGYNAILVSF